MTGLWSPQLIYDVQGFPDVDLLHRPHYGAPPLIAGDPFHHFWDEILLSGHTESDGTFRFVSQFIPQSNEHIVDVNYRCTGYELNTNEDSALALSSSPVSSWGLPMSYDPYMGYHETNGPGNTAALMMRLVSFEPVADPYEDILISCLTGKGIQVPPTSRNLGLWLVPLPANDSKPNLPFRLLIALAIYGSPSKALALNEIYEALIMQFPWFRLHQREEKWKSATRSRTIPNL
ncbi:hypothetical protein R3P38DRAFT_3445969 [Favolaschia claudopus]|uniref:Fork-head domain-containing protein n=1 Tax=Favolaschia claudopus TaxID=2862362 RepID=A0AAV9ZMW7_9AGAR